jgi:hypothetical protein
MRIALLALGLFLAGCANTARNTDIVDSELLRHIEGYAIASCLVLQPEPYLRDQGDAWASVIVQRLQGSLDPLVRLAEVVQRENGHTGMAVMRDEMNPGQDKTLPLMHCFELMDRPSVRDAILDAVAEERSR